MQLLDVQLRTLHLTSGVRCNYATSETETDMHATLHMSAISRSNGRNAVGASAYRSGTAVTYRSAVACAAYRAGEKMKDDRYEKNHDYTKKHNVLHSEIIAPEGAPDWMTNREKLWNGVEAGEKRKDAQLAKEALLILPRNLTVDEQKDVVRGFIHDNLTSRGLIADYAIHAPDAADGEKNPHAHVMFTLRPVEGQGFGKKLTGYKNGGLDGVEFLQDMQLSYEKHLNDASEKAESEIRFDLVKHRDLQRRKTLDDRYHQPETNTPTPVWHIEKRGESSTIGQARRKAEQQNYATAAQSGHRYYSAYNQITYLAAKGVDHVRDDLAHKYYEVMYGAEHAYGGKIKSIINRGMIDNKNALNDLGRKPAEPGADELDGRDGAYDALVKVRGRKSPRFHIITAEGHIIGCGYAYLLGWYYTPTETLTIFTTTHQFTLTGTGMEEIERALLREVVYELREYNEKEDMLRPGYTDPIIKKLTIRSVFDKTPKNDATSRE